MKKGTIILVNLDPTKGSETGKIRPCIIVTNDVYNKKLPVVQVVPITAWSEKKEKIITNVIIEKSNDNHLAKKSIADCLQTRPIDYRKRLIKAIGIVDKETISKIDQALKIVFGLK